MRLLLSCLVLASLSLSPVPAIHITHLRDQIALEAASDVTETSAHELMLDFSNHMEAFVGAPKTPADMVGSGGEGRGGGEGRASNRKQAIATATDTATDTDTQHMIVPTHSNAVAASHSA